MDNTAFFNAFRKHIGGVIFSGILAGALGMAFVFLSGTDYEARTDFLVSQEGMESKDYYTVARSAEYIGKILGEVVYSEKFIDTALSTGKMNQDVLPLGKRDRLRAWSDMVKVEKRLDVGILRVVVRNDNQKESIRISQAITQVLTEKNHLFLGTGEHSVPVSVLSGPISEENPNMQEVFAAVFGGFFFGVLLASGIAFLRSELPKKKSVFHGFSA